MSHAYIHLYIPVIFHISEFFENSTSAKLNKFIDFYRYTTNFSMIFTIISYFLSIGVLQCIEKQLNVRASFYGLRDN